MRRRQRALAKVVLPIAVVTPTTALSVPATFAPPVTYQLGAGFQSPSGLGIHDLNADGDLDVVIGALDINSFSVFPGAGDGTLGPATTVSTTNSAAPSNAYRPRTVAIGDINNDGRADLYFAGYGVNDNIVSLNQSSGGVLGFGTPAYISAVQAPSTPALGDLNEDGNLDVVQPGYNGGNGNANTVLTRMGNGNGTFQASSQLFTNPLPGEGSNGAAIADINGDGNLDVLAVVNAIGGGSPRQGAVMTALGNGNGTFQAPAGVALVGANASPQSLLILDINGDGHLDVLTGNGSSVSTLLGNGTGTFATGTADSNLVGYSLAAADVNGDGLTDVALADWSGDRVSVALGNGDGTFDPPSFIAMPAGSNPYGLAIADLNGDGLGDIVVGTYAGGTPSGGTLSVLQNTTAAAAPTITGATPATGSTAGGTSVTITGTGFTGAGDAGAEEHLGDDAGRHGHALELLHVLRGADDHDRDACGGTGGREHRADDQRHELPRRERRDGGRPAGDEPGHLRDSDHGPDARRRCRRAGHRGDDARRVGDAHGRLHVPRAADGGERLAVVRLACGRDDDHGDGHEPVRRDGGEGGVGQRNCTDVGR